MHVSMHVACKLASMISSHRTSVLGVYAFGAFFTQLSSLLVLFFFWQLIIIQLIPKNNNVIAAKMLTLRH